MQRAGEGQSRREVRFKENRELAPAVEGIESPYEAEARYRSRYATVWTGYLVHLIETCADEKVHLITHVQTTVATIHESQQTAAIQQALVEKQFLQETSFGPTSQQPRPELTQHAEIKAGLAQVKTQQILSVNAGRHRRLPVRELLPKLRIVTSAKRQGA